MRTTPWGGPWRPDISDSCSATKPRDRRAQPLAAEPAALQLTTASAPRRGVARNDPQVGEKTSDGFWARRRPGLSRRRKLRGAVARPGHARSGRRAGAQVETAAPRRMERSVPTPPTAAALSSWTNGSSRCNPTPDHAPLLFGKLQASPRTPDSRSLGRRQRMSNTRSEALLPRRSCSSDSTALVSGGGRSVSRHRRRRGAIRGPN